MTAKTKYSRSTWKKKQLQQSMNTPHFGNNSCSLCADRSIPQDLNAHVSDLQTCADVHLQLALLRYDNAMCSVGQAQYQELCCTKKGSKHVLKSSLGFLAGIFLVGYILRKLSTKPKNGRKNRDDNGNKASADGLPMTHQSSSGSSGSGSSNKSKGSSELESPTTTYQNMDNLAATMIQINSQSRSHSKGRPQSRSRSRGRPQSHPQSHSRDRSQSRSRTLTGSLSRSDNIKRSSSRIASDSHQRSVSRGKLTQNRSRSRSKSRDRRPPPKKADGVEHDHRDWPTGHVIAYDINPYHRHEEVEVSRDAGPILPTQLV